MCFVSGGRAVVGLAVDAWAGAVLLNNAAKEVIGRVLPFAMTAMGFFAGCAPRRKDDEI